MTTLPELARRLVEEPPPAPAPDLADLRKRNTRRSRRRLALAATAMVAVALLGAASIAAVGRDSGTGPRRVNAGPGPSSTPSRAGPTVTTPSEAPDGPPPPERQAVGLEVSPSVLDPDGGTSVTLAVRNDSEREVAWSCGELSLRLDRWGAGGWRPLGYGFDQLGVLDPSRFEGNDCFTQGIVGPHQVEQVAGPVSSPRLGPGWYRWVDDRPTWEERTGELAIEGRFRVEQPGRPPEPQPASRTAWLAGGDRLRGLRLSGATEALVIDDSRLALTWTSSCNAPGAAVTFDLHTDRIEVQLLTGYYQGIDCVGDPAGPWSTVVDLPELLAGRSLVVAGAPGDLVAKNVESKSVFEPDHSGGAPATLGPWLLRPGPGDLVLHWHGTTCDRPLHVELIDLGDRIFPRAAVTEEDCPGDDGGWPAKATVPIPDGLRDLPIVGVL